MGVHGGHSKHPGAFGLPQHGGGMGRSDGTSMPFTTTR